MLVLASASPRRQELLRNAGIPFTVYPANIPEVPQREKARAIVLNAWRAKKRWQFFTSIQLTVVLGADTIVVVDGEMLGKPKDEADAMRMLRLLSGRTHQVITGVCLVGPSLRTGNQKLETGFNKTSSETTLVTMTKLTDEDIRLISQPANPWTKPALTLSRESHHAGFRASKAIISTSWVYRWRWCAGCFRRMAWARTKWTCTKTIGRKTRTNSRPSCPGLRRLSRPT